MVGQGDFGKGAIISYDGKRVGLGTRSAVWKKSFVSLNGYDEVPENLDRGAAVDLVDDDKGSATGGEGMLVGQPTHPVTHVEFDRG
jgi:hypothetical protein